MTLTDVVTELERDARAPKPIIEAHKLTLAALVALTKRIEALEAANKKAR
jgi:leucyl aminopeptidase